MSNHLKLLTLDSKLFTVLPVETVIRDRQEGYYAAPVSYTHLDVYKRQVYDFFMN